MLLRMQDALTVACGLPHFNNTERLTSLAPFPPLLRCYEHLSTSPNRGGSKGREGGARATAQSVAARDRRKKISDKTQELGKLVPGAANSKMNTADMLQSAFQYVKFLQAQVSVLQLMGSDSSSQEEGKEGIKTENLKIVASSAGEALHEG